MQDFYHQQYYSKSRIRTPLMRLSLRAAPEDNRDSLRLLGLGYDILVITIIITIIIITTTTTTIIVIIIIVVIVIVHTFYTLLFLLF